MKQFVKLSKVVFGASALVTALFFTGCDKTEEPAVEENITTIIVHLTGPGFDKEFSWDDTNGDGIANTIDTIVIPPLTGNINCHLHVYDRSGATAVDLSEEIEGESADHLFVYAATPADILNIGSLNTDSNGAPFGIESVWQTDQPKSGTVNVKLYHLPTNKSNPADPGGSVDFDVTFPVRVQ